MNCAWIVKGNEALNIVGGTEQYLETQHVLKLAGEFAGDTHVPTVQHMLAAQAWPLTVGSLDWVARQLAESVVSFQGSNVGAPPRVANSS